MAKRADKRAKPARAKAGGRAGPKARAARAKAAPKHAAKPARKAPANAAASASLFGTDGVRGVAGKGPLTPESVLAIGRSLSAQLAAGAKATQRPAVLIGTDSRPSADLLVSALACGLTAGGCDVHWPGLMSTPEVAFLTGRGPFAAGIAVTASHNAAADNGIKLFGRDGRKLDTGLERRIEQAVHNGKAGGDAAGLRGAFGHIYRGRGREYEEYLAEAFRDSLALTRRRPLSLVLDAAFGARSVDVQTMNRLARSLAFGQTTPALQIGASIHGGASNGLDVYFFNAVSPGRPESRGRINEGCGSLHPEGCARAVRELKADLGVCFDGDGDRCILVDETGAVRDGDHMLALLAADMKSRGQLAGDIVVSTTMANYGLERALADLGVRLLRVEVGDRNVTAAMDKHGAMLGGEQSGHIVLADRGHFTGDGLYTALRVVQVMLETGKPLSELCAPVRKFPQAIANVRANRKAPLTELKNLAAQRRAVEAELGVRGRVNLRYSGTEPLLRIMVEAEDQTALNAAIHKLTQAARKDLKT
jgi:phosphoglucosamine mutase